MTSYCPNCGQNVDKDDRFCRQCGRPLKDQPGPSFGMKELTPEVAASYWRNFFRPFFKTAFLFFAFFFGISILLVIFWYFKFGNN